MQSLLCRIENRYGADAGTDTQRLPNLHKLKHQHAPGSRLRGTIRHYIRRRLNELRRAKYGGLPERYWGRNLRTYFAICDDNRHRGEHPHASRY